jgi:predicted Rossmann fold flavoprotein
MKKIAIVGGGASGIACAIELKRNLKDIEVTILERLPRIGKKILMTGNGKCNITNMNLSSNDYNSDIIDELLEQFNYAEAKAFFESMGLMMRVDETGRAYPYSEKATTVLDVMVNELERLNVKVKTDYDVGEIKRTDSFLVYSNDYQVYNYDYVVMATGGLASVPEHNSYDLLERLGHHITDISPGLVALKTLESTKSLSGIRVKAKATIKYGNNQSQSRSGEILFKNDGLSGIAIFELSRFYQKNAIVSIDLIPDISDNELDGYFKNTKSIEEVLNGILPKMVSLDIINRCKVINKENIIKLLHNYDFTIIDTYGFINAQITLGGVNRKEVNPFTYASLIVDRMYIIGEVNDIDGASGGYNLHYAWGSGIVAARDIIRKITESE